MQHGQKSCVHKQLFFGYYNGYYGITGVIPSTGKQLMTSSVFLLLKSLVFLLLSLSFLFEFLLSLLLLPAQTPPASPPLSLHNCLFSFMPVTKESSESVKVRLVREQKLRTERWVQALLHPRDRRGEEEHDDSEEENRIIARRARGTKEQATQTNSSSWSFCCGVFLEC